MFNAAVVYKSGHVNELFHRLQALSSFYYETRVIYNSTFEQFSVSQIYESNSLVSEQNYMLVKLICISIKAKYAPPHSVSAIVTFADFYTLFDSKFCF